MDTGLNVTRVKDCLLFLGESYPFQDEAAKTNYHTLVDIIDNPDDFLSADGITPLTLDEITEKVNAAKVTAAEPPVAPTVNVSDFVGKTDEEILAMVKAAEAKS